MSEDDEILQAFLEESREGLDQLELDLVELEARPRDPELLGQIYRAVHSIKGTCGFLGYERLEAVTHRGEDVLDALRSGSIDFDPGVATSLLSLTDVIRTLLDSIEATGEDGSETDPALLARLGAHLEASATAPVAAEPAASPAGAPADVVREIRSTLHESSIRVDVEVLDRLMDLVGELVLVRGRVGELAAAADGGSLVESYRQLRRVSGELLEGVMRARLQPVGNVTRKFPRIARDLAASMDKQVRVQLDGEEVGVDRAVNEALGDALVHLVRNVVDHGLESPADRLAADKPAEGLLKIAASHEGGRVHIEVSDDGRGIDPDQVLARAISTGRITPEEGVALDLEGRLELIFLPGLSTKGSVTSVSGRGVGMDAVRANLERVGGTIGLASEPGRGTVFGIDVPLTVAIVPAVIVWAGGGRYCIPQTAVQEVIQLDSDAVRAAVSVIDGAQLYRQRGALLPLVELADQLGVSSQAAAESGLTAVVLDADGRRFGLVVDSIGDAIDAVVKPLTRGVRSIPLFGGVSIMADGRPSLILDVHGLADAAGLQGSWQPPAEQAAPLLEKAPSMLVAHGNGGRRLAVEMTRVWRLERFPRDRVAVGSEVDVIDYGDVLLPLLRLDRDRPAVLPGATGDEVEVIVCESSAGRVGLVVESIEDVVTAAVVPSPLPGRPDLARLELGGLVTELLDVEALVAGVGAWS